MRAATIVDGAISVTGHPDPSPGHGEVLVAVRAAGLNGADLMQLRGLYPAPPGSPADIPGLELAGEVVAVGAGARVCATVRAAELRDAVERLGADVVVSPDAFAAHAPFDVVIELVGARNLAGDLEALATGGRIVVIGIGAGARTEIDLRALMRARGSVMSSTLRARPLEEKALCARRVEKEVLPALAAGRLRVPIAARYPLAAAAQAYDRFQAGAKLGKIIVELSPD